MSDLKVSKQKHIEARLDRSLRNQLQAPRLDRSFDAAVWGRIAQQEANAGARAVKAAPTRALRASRWISVINSVGITLTLGVALYFALGSLGGIEPPPLSVDLDVSMPVISEDTLQGVIRVLGQVLGAAALVFGLSFTSFGRRVRASFS